MTSGRLAPTFILVSLLAWAVTAHGASFPPELKFRSLDVGRVTVHYHQGLEEMARRVAALAPGILEGHEKRYGVRLRRLHVVLADTEDEPNGFATPLPYPLVHLRAVAPDGTDDSGNYDDWMRLILTHELAHSVHLEAARGLLKAGRHVFGRAPFLFPNGAAPTWMIEGLATYEETNGTAFGRGRNPDSQMVVRMAALERNFPGEDRANRGIDRWPGGQAPYLFGEQFLRALSERRGDGTLPELSRVHSGRPIPYLDDLTARKVTGATFHQQWQLWAREERRAAESEAARRGERGLTESCALTTRAVRQAGPRFAPDGAWIAYTNRNLSEYRAIHLVRPDGTGDRRLTWRNSGTELSFTPDGQRIVYDELDISGLFRTRSDLKVVDVRTGRKRRITRGLRARDPDVSPDGRNVVFVRQRGDRSDLALVGLAGQELRDLTHSEPGVQWGGPTWSPTGDRLAASRFRPGGWLDIVLVDPVSGEVTPLLEDRAKDAEPAFTPDGRHVIFRSDRDGVSNLYALRLEDRALLRVTNVLGGAFEPSVSPDGASLAFSTYGSRGYDVHLMPFSALDLPGAEAFVDPYPQPFAEAAPTTVPDRSYRPWPTFLPRFWMPYVETGNELRIGVASGGTDPLFRHAYGLDVHGGFDTERVGFRGFYQYDRFRPTFVALVDDAFEQVNEGKENEGVLHTRELQLRASYPLERRFRRQQSLSLAFRRSREVLAAPRAPGPTDLAGLETAWQLSTVRSHPYSISPSEGIRLRLAYLREVASLGSDVTLGKATADLRTYSRVFGKEDILALRVGGGATFGRPSFERSFAVGGFPDGSLFDLVRTNHSVLRGYPDSIFLGRRFAHANAEYRFPLGHPQRGWRSLPLFVRHLHAAVFGDAAHAWSGRFRLEDVKTGAGVALGGDFVLGHAVPVTATVGVARGFAEQGETRAYFRAGLSF